MKNYRDSDYAVNKYASGIVYRFADQTVMVTVEDYLQENSDKTEADFAELKAISDEIYEEQSRDANRQTYKNVSLHCVDETDIGCVPSPETIFFGALEETTSLKNRKTLAKRALATLTDIQRRRYLLYTVDGLSTWEIAKMEGVNQPNIMKSLRGAEKKIKNILDFG